MFACLQQHEHETAAERDGCDAQTYDAMSLANPTAIRSGSNPSANCCVTSNRDPLKSWYTVFSGVFVSPDGAA